MLAEHCFWRVHASHFSETVSAVHVRQASARQNAELAWIPAGKTTLLTELVHLIREHIASHPQDCLNIIKSATGEREEGCAEQTLQRLLNSVSEGRELVCWLRYVWAS